MKAFQRFSLLLFAVMALSFQSCIKDNCEREVTYVKAIPVFMPEEDIRIDIVPEAPRNLSKPGKIFLHHNLVFISEINEGIHVIDNTNPESPVPVTFIPVPGNIDIAARGNTLYADSYMDLLAFDISIPGQIRLEKRERDVFPLGGQNEKGEYLVRYTFEEVTETVACNDSGWRGGAFSIAGEDDFVNTTLNGTVVNSSRASTSTAGSMSRFALHNDYLYTLQDQTMTLFDISQPANPVLSSRIELQVSAGAETLFPFDDKLFVGTRSGMLIYSNSNPQQPVFISQFWHATACDPVFVKDNYAYVTLRNGTGCNGWRNNLDLVDITDIHNPQLTRSFDMINPHGLSIFNNTLFLCEGDFGLKVFDIEEPTTLVERQLAHFRDFAAFDAIAFRNSTQHLLMVVGKDGLYQFNFDDPADIKQLSVIPVQ